MAAATLGASCAGTPQDAAGAPRERPLPLEPAGGRVGRWLLRSALLDAEEAGSNMDTRLAAGLCVTGATLAGSRSCSCQQELSSSWQTV